MSDKQNLTGLPVAERLAIQHRRDDSGCWEWTGARFTSGYGRLKVDGRSRGAHRVMYELVNGPVPAGLELDHLCRNRACVNPDHLEPVTHAENVRRGDAGDRRVVTHCIRGHEFTDENTYMHPRGKRECRTCRRARHQLSAPEVASLSISGAEPLPLSDPGDDSSEWAPPFGIPRPEAVA